VRITQFRIEGLGHLSTLLADDDAGVAAIVDPRRDVDVYLDAARAADLRISHVVETHLHNDYVSGARELAAQTGATHVIGAGAELRYEHRGTRDGEAFDVGALRFTALETPGHTPEHVTYAVSDTSRADEPVLLLTGGSLLVGSVGRTDLLGADQALPYAHEMYRSLHEVILRQEDFVGVYPTHGSGSLCSTGISSTPSSTVGYERRHDPLLDPSLDVAAFAQRLLAGQPTVPRYFARMRPTNQAGPRLLGAHVPAIPPRSVEAVEAAIGAGAVVVDARPASAHVAGHLPGALSMPAGTSFGTWLGWIVEPDRPVVLVVDGPGELDDLARQALRVGCETVAGYLQGGLARWVEAGRPIETSGRLSVDELAAALDTDPAEAPLVIDVRQADEYAGGHVPGAIHLTAGSLPDRLADLPRDRPIATICGSGYRASVAASLLRAAGFQDVSWVATGVPAWQAAGYEVQRGGDADTGTRPVPDPDPRSAEDPLVPHRH
jgi:hydroxyacylglutathione hydrolase